MGMNTTNHGKDSNGNWVPMGAATDASGNPAGLTVQGESKFSISGTLKTYVLAPDAGTPADVDAERINDSTGFKAFRVIPHLPAIASFEGIVFGYSTDAGAISAIGSVVDAVALSLVTPDGTPYQNCGVILPSFIGATPTGGAQWSGDLNWITYDGTTTIKTIAVRSVGADHDAGVVVQVIQ